MNEDWTWYASQYDRRVYDERVGEGRCGYCGAFDGPDHRCPEHQ